MTATTGVTITPKTLMQRYELSGPMESGLMGASIKLPSHPQRWSQKTIASLAQHQESHDSRINKLWGRIDSTRERRLSRYPFVSSFDSIDALSPHALQEWIDAEPDDALAAAAFQQVGERYADARVAGHLAFEAIESLMAVGEFSVTPVSRNAELITVSAYPAADGDTLPDVLRHIDTRLTAFGGLAWAQHDSTGLQIGLPLLETPLAVSLPATAANITLATKVVYGVNQLIYAVGIAKSRLVVTTTLGKATLGSVVAVGLPSTFGDLGGAYVLETTQDAETPETHTKLRSIEGIFLPEHQSALSEAEQKDARLLMAFIDSHHEKTSDHSSLVQWLGKLARSFLATLAPAVSPLNQQSRSEAGQEALRALIERLGLSDWVTFGSNEPLFTVSKPFYAFRGKPVTSVTPIFETPYAEEAIGGALSLKNSECYGKLGLNVAEPIALSLKAHAA